MQSLQGRVFGLRAAFATWLSERRMFLSIGIAAQCDYVVNSALGALAGIRVEERPTLLLSPRLLDLFDRSSEAAFFILLHELRHIVQVGDYRQSSRLLNLNCVDALIANRLAMRNEPRTKWFRVEEIPGFRYYFFNNGADIAIHEDLRKLFDASIIKVINDFIAEERDAAHEDNAGKEWGILTVESVSASLGIKLERDRDWLYYAKAILANYAERLASDPDGIEHLLNLGFETYLKKNKVRTDNRLQEAYQIIDVVQRAGIHAHRMERQLEEAITPEATLQRYEPSPGDVIESISNRNRLNHKLRDALALVRRAARPSAIIKPKTSRSYHCRHRFLRSLPGEVSTVQPAAKKSVVLVLDTSGSMWFSELLEQMMALARALFEKSEILALYTCDDDLRRIELRNQTKIDVIGGGGTSWTRDHHDIILRDLGSPNRLAIIYCTDEAVFGLRDAKKDTRVELTVLNIPSILRW